ncbi:MULTISPECIES: hypothetical protein [unclassified Hydrogenobaculum]|uniref:hypothetical protein n=1 Tax=Hydrogenobaculum sp. (strain Y04AAS1) TaxID=380749 RepID=UPI0030809185
MRVSKTYRLSSKAIMKIEALVEKLDISATEVIERAIEEFYSKEIKGLQCIAIEKYNEAIDKLKESNDTILDLNKQIMSLYEKIKQLEYDKISLEFKLKEKEKAYNRLKKKVENVPFWRKDLTELFGAKDEDED